MDAARTDTLSSGRFGGQWAFLSSPPQHDQPRSLPPSSYIRSDPSSVSRLPTSLHLQHLNASRSTLPRNIYSSSAGGHCSATLPSQPVLVRAHSAEASAHLHPAPRQPRRRAIMTKTDTLPPIEEFSIQGILAAIQDDIEGDINAISEILGRSRLVLADQHDSHLPPQGEIRASSVPLQAVQEASSSAERLAGDDVLILHEEASLVEGSQSGSAAYGLLERLQARPRTSRSQSDQTPLTSRIETSNVRQRSLLPISLPQRTHTIGDQETVLSRNQHNVLRHSLHHDGLRVSDPTVPDNATRPLVCETYLSAGANGRMFSDPPIICEAGRHYPLYSYDESEVFATSDSSSDQPRSLRQRVQRLVSVRELPNIMGFLNIHSNENAGEELSAEVSLREILNRQQRTGLNHPHGSMSLVAEPDLYD